MARTAGAGAGWLVLIRLTTWENDVICDSNCSFWIEVAWRDGGLRFRCFHSAFRGCFLKKSWLMGGVISVSMCNESEKAGWD